MPWDVFLSHASEDKALIAEPLARALDGAGISVWIDRDQITLGDGLQRTIDRGLSHARYGVVVLSKAFFRKDWTSAELGALFAKEKGGRKVILPILHDMTFDELGEQSPLLAGRLTAKWNEGVSEVVAKIAQVVLGKKPTLPSTVVHTPAAAPRSVPNKDRLLLFSAKVDPIIVPYRGLQRGSKFLVEATPEAQDQIVSLRALARSPRDKVGIAYGLQALEGEVVSIDEAREGGQDIWRLTFRPLDNSSANSFMEPAVNGISADEIAKMRAEVILLDARPVRKRNATSRNQQGDVDPIFDVFIRGVNTSIKTELSPFPFLFQTFHSDRDAFLEAARLFGVLFVTLSGAVEHVYKLDLHLDDATGKLRVDFKGKRPRKYTNVEPPVIEVSGECDLTKSPPGLGKGFKF